MRLFSKGLLIALLMVLPAHTVYGGAWLSPAGEFSSYHDITYYSTDHYYDLEGTKQSQPRYQKIEQSNRMEYGWDDSLTLGAAFGIAAVRGTKSIFFGQVTQFTDPIQIDATTWNLGFSDPKFYGRYKLWDDEKSVLSTQATLKLPSLFQHHDFPRTGSDKFSYEARLLAGHNFNWLNDSQFTNIELAYEWRPHNDGSLIHADVTLGWKLNEKFMILPQIFSTWSMNNDSNSFTQSGNDSYDLVKPQLSATYKFHRLFTLQAGAFHHTYARNSGGGSGVMLGLWVKP